MGSSGWLEDRIREESENVAEIIRGAGVASTEAVLSREPLQFYGPYYSKGLYLVIPWGGRMKLWGPYKGPVGA